MAINLSDAQVARIVSWASSTPSIKEIWLRGSRARGCARSDSDVDLVLTVVDYDGDAVFTVFFDNHEKWSALLEQALSLRVHPVFAASSSEADGMRDGVGFILYRRAD